MVLPPFMSTLPKGVISVKAHQLTVGDILFVQTAASGDPVRSLITGIQGNRYTVMNRLHPDPYEIWMPDTKSVLVLKMRPSAQRVPSPFNRDTFRDRGFEPPEVSDDPRSYWNWDPKDARAFQEHYAVEEREWRRLKYWEQSHRAAKKPPPKTNKSRVRGPKIDYKVREWYKALNVRAGVTPKQLKAALKKRLFETHPDRCKDPNAEENFKRASAAYQGLLGLLTKK